MQNPLLKFRQSSIISEKLGYLSEKLKALTSSNYDRVKYFLLKFWTGFLLTNIYKRQNFPDKIPGFSKTIELCLNFVWDFVLLN